MKHLKSYILLLLLLATVTFGQDYDDYGRRNRRRRPQHNQQSSGPCGRFFGLSYVNLNYNVDCGGQGGHGGGGSLSDFLGGQGSNGGGHHRPQKPHRPQGGGLGGGIHGVGGGTGSGDQQSEGAYGQNPSGGLFNRPIWGPIGNLASNIGNTVGSFANGIGGNGGGAGNFGGGGAGNLFDGSIFNSFASLFSNSNSPSQSSPSFNRPQRPQPAPVTVTRPPQTTDGLPNVEPHPVVPIVDLRPVHEEYYDEVTEQTIFGSTNSKFLDNRNRYVSAAPFGGSYSNHHNHQNGGLFDINYNKAFKKINRQFNQAFNYLFRR